MDACDAISADGWLAWALCCQNSQFHRLMMGGGGLSVQYWPGNWVIRFSHPSMIAWSRPAPMVPPVTRARSPPSEASVIRRGHNTPESVVMSVSTLNTRLEIITGHDCALPDLSEYWRKWMKLLMFNFTFGSWLMPADEKTSTRSTSSRGVHFLVSSHRESPGDPSNCQCPCLGPAQCRENSGSDVNENSFHARWINLGRWTTTIKHRLCPGPKTWKLRKTTL